MATTKYVWVGDNVLYETDGADAVTVTYTYAPEGYGNLLSEQRGGVTYTHHYDAQGSTLALTDDTGVVTDTFRYTAWGEEVVRTGTTPTPFRWIGEKGYSWNDSAGRYDVRRRGYIPAIARWCSQDPIEALNARNLFLYAGNNPLIVNDPSGLFDEQPVLRTPQADTEVRCCECNLAKAYAEETGRLKITIKRGREIERECNVRVECVKGLVGGRVGCGKTFNRDAMGNGVKIEISCDCRPAWIVLVHELIHAEQSCRFGSPDPNPPNLRTCRSCTDTETPAAEAHCTEAQKINPTLDLRKCVQCSVALSCIKYCPDRPKCTCEEIGQTQIPKGGSCDPSQVK